MKNRSSWMAFVLVVSVLSFVFASPPAPAMAASGDDIEDSIGAGLEWLADEQNADGSWATVYETSNTCFALIKFQERAYELGYSSPFDPAYEYSNVVEDGWSYIFGPSSAGVVSETLSLQDHTAGATGTWDDPDTTGNGYGIHFQEDDDSTPAKRNNYATGICLIALGASHTPNHPNEGGLDFDGDGDADTFLEIAQESVDWYAWAQGDLGYGEGGWSYDACDNASKGRTQNTTPDQSNHGYAVMGIAAAEKLGATVPDWVRTELDVYTNNIQDPVDGDEDDGGSWYRPEGASDEYAIINQLKAGNLIFQMAFLGDDPSTQRFQDALDYIERHWRDPDVGNTSSDEDGWGYAVDPICYQCTYALMRGLEYSSVDFLDTDGDGNRDDNWYNQEPPTAEPEDFASAIIAEQNPNGSWPDTCYRGTGVLCTTWALLSLERFVPHGMPDPPYVLKGVTEDTLPVGETTTFTFTGAIPKNYPSYHDVTLTDTLPAGLGYVSSSAITVTYDQDGDDGGPETVVVSSPTSEPGQYDTGQVIWELGDITGSATITGSITAVVRDVPSNQDGVTLTNAITMSYWVGSYTHRLHDTAEVEVTEPQMEVAKMVDASGDLDDLDGSDLLTYTIYLNNTGSTLAYSVYVTDAVPSGISVTQQYGGDVRGGSVAGPDEMTWYLNTVDPGTTVLSYTACISGAVSDDILTNTVEAVYYSVTDTRRGARQYDAGDDAASVRTDVPVVGKAASKSPILVGDTITYHLVFTVPAGLVGMGSDSYLLDELPAGVWYVPGSDDLVWTPPAASAAMAGPAIGTLHGAQVLTWTIAPVVSVQDSPTVVTLTFEAQVTDRDAAGDPVWVDHPLNSITNTVTLVQRDYSASDTATSQVKTVADLGVSKHCAPDRVVLGHESELVCTIVYTNYGPSYAHGVVLTDTLPDSTAYGTVVSSTKPILGSTQVTQTVSWSTDTLPIGISGSIAFTSTVSPDVAGSLTNTVVITAATVDPDISNNRDVAVIQVLPPVGGSTEVSSYQLLLRRPLRALVHWLRKGGNSLIEK